MSSLKAASVCSLFVSSFQTKQNRPERET